MTNRDPDGHRRRRGGGWFALLVTVLTVAGLVIYGLVEGGDSGSVNDVADQAQEAAGGAGGTVTGAGDDAADTVTGEAGDAGDAVNGAADDAGDAATGGAGGEAPAAVRNDPVVQRLARGRELPFTVGPWRQAAWRDSVYERLRPQTQERAQKLRVRSGYGIRLR
jgi:hypothetical protein